MVCSEKVLNVERMSPLRAFLDHIDESGSGFLDELLNWWGPRSPKGQSNK